MFKINRVWHGQKYGKFRIEVEYLYGNELMTVVETSHLGIGYALRYAVGYLVKVADLAGCRNVVNDEKDYWNTLSNFELEKESFAFDTSQDSKPVLTELVPDSKAWVPCPECNSEYEDELISVIIHLNDDHEMTREFIADWLDGLDLNLEFTLQGENNE